MSNEKTEWPYDEDRTYHGVQAEYAPTRIFVELSEFGPTERKSPVRLRKLASNMRGLDFGWGYNGHGTSAAAEAILRDALGEAPSSDLREDFCEDVLAHMADEFWLRRGAILRWARGWAEQHDLQTLPAVIVDLPPVSPNGYEPRPSSVRNAGASSAGSPNRAG